MRKELHKHMKDNRYENKRPRGAGGEKGPRMGHREKKPYSGQKPYGEGAREAMKNRRERAWEEEETGGESLAPQFFAGRNAVLELLKSGRAVDKVYVRRDGERTGSISLIVAEALGKGIPVVEVEVSKLDFMANGVNHQGVVASAAAKEYCTVEEILAIAKERGEAPFLVMADGIEDPQNLGTLIRVCECAGVHGLIIPTRRSVGLTEVVAKASAGAISHMAIAKVGNFSQTIEKLKEQGLWIYAAEADGVPYDEVDMTGPAVILMGSEGFGVQQNHRANSDFTVSIPMYGQVNSLNVSTAAAVIIHAAARQRRKSR